MVVGLVARHVRRPLLLFLGFVFAPEAVIRHTYQAWYVSDDDARKRSTIP